MHTESASIAHHDDRPTDPWAILAGGSMSIVIGFGVDLFRLGVHEARLALSARPAVRRVATRGWQCQAPCDAGAR
jgi:hypothetical protein